jgi:hypothetical protein
MYDHPMALPVALVVVVCGVWGLNRIVEPRLEAALSAAPARVVAYLDALGVAPQGTVLCREAQGSYHLVAIECDAMVGNVLTRFSCDTATCWPR